MFNALFFTKFKIAFLNFNYLLFHKQYFTLVTYSINFNFTINLESAQNETICPKIWKVAYFLRKFAL
jgi:hypothetical protein